MSEERFSLKDHLFNPEGVGQLAAQIKSVHSSFNDSGFVERVLLPFPELELLDRAKHIKDMFGVFLPSDYRVATGILLDSLPPPLDPNLTDDDFGEFIYLPHGLFVVEHGVTKKYLSFSLNAVKELTKRFSMESPIRYFLNEFPEETMAELAKWVEDENYHVRRLVSEGTRPKLPWAQRITLSYQQPVPFLHALHSDKTRYVTRSVANHLNDISKLDPMLAIEIVQDWQARREQNAKELAFLTRHSLRTLAKDGHPEALRVLGYEKPELSLQTLECHTKKVKVGKSLSFSFTFASKAKKEQRLLVDYVLWFKKANGDLAPKTFHVTKRTLGPGVVVDFEKQHPLRRMTTRKLYSGVHKVELQVNGHRFGSFEFELVE